MTTQRRFTLLVGGDVDPSLNKAFGLMSDGIEDTTKELQDAREEQNRLLKALRKTKEGSEEYEKLQREVKQTERRVNALTDDLGRQQRQWRRLGRVSSAATKGMVAGFGAAAVAAGGMVLALKDAVGEVRNILFAAAELEVPVEFIQDLQNLGKIAGEEINTEELTREFIKRLGEARALGTGPLVDALKLVGYTVDEVSTKDLPKLLAAVEKLPRDVQLTFFDRAFGGGVAKALTAISALDEQSRETAEGIRTLNEAELNDVLRANEDLTQMTENLRILALQTATKATPAIKEFADQLLPWVELTGDLLETYPNLLSNVAKGAAVFIGAAAAIKAVSIAMQLYAARAKIASIAQAAFLALQGPTGWAILAGAAVAATAAGVAIGNIQEDLADTRAQKAADEALADAQAEAIKPAAYEGTFEGAKDASKDAAKENAQATREELEQVQGEWQNVLPTEVCEAIDDLTPKDPPAPLPQPGEDGFIGPLQQFGPSPEITQEGIEHAALGGRERETVTFNSVTEAVKLGEIEKDIINQDREVFGLTTQQLGFNPIETALLGMLERSGIAAAASDSLKVTSYRLRQPEVAQYFDGGGQPQWNVPQQTAEDMSTPSNAEQGFIGPQLIPGIAPELPPQVDISLSVPEPNINIPRPDISVPEPNINIPRPPASLRNIDNRAYNSSADDFSSRSVTVYQDVTQTVTTTETVREIEEGLELANESAKNAANWGR